MRDILVNFLFLYRNNEKLFKDKSNGDAIDLYLDTIRYKEHGQKAYIVYVASGRYDGWELKVERIFFDKKDADAHAEDINKYHSHIQDFDYCTVEEFKIT